MLTRYPIAETIDVLSATEPTEDEAKAILDALVKEDEELENLLIVHASEITEAVQEAIANMLFGFRPAFLSKQTGIPVIVFERLSDLCESANDAIFAIIEQSCGFEQFCEEAVASDGLGNFLSSYDGYTNEFELKDFGPYYYFRE